MGYCEKCNVNESVFTIYSEAEPIGVCYKCYKEHEEENEICYCKRPAKYCECP